MLSFIDSLITHLYHCSDFKEILNDNFEGVLLSGVLNDVKLKIIYMVTHSTAYTVTLMVYELTTT